MERNETRRAYELIYERFYRTSNLIAIISSNDIEMQIAYTHIKVMIKQKRETMHTYRPQHVHIP